jgi:hypothetical protein
MKHTKKCVRCLERPAVQWSGYVMKGRHKHGAPDLIIAGWCRICLKFQPIFHGHYKREMGVEKGLTPKGTG